MARDVSEMSLQHEFISVSDVSDRSVLSSWGIRGVSERGMRGISERSMKGMSERGMRGMFDSMIGGVSDREVVLPPLTRWLRDLEMAESCCGEETVGLDSLLLVDGVSVMWEGIWEELLGCW